MKEIYIHVGMGKTGTTAIQEFCWKNRKQLQKDGLHYPKIGVMSGAHHLLSPHIPPFLKDNKAWHFLEVKEWVDDLKSIKEEKVLISSELIAWASEEKVKDFCSELKKHFDVKIIFYFRRQEDAIMSGYNQSIKAGLQCKTLEDSFDKMLEKFNYLERIQPWIESVGENNVFANIYGKNVFYKSDLIKDFFYRNLNTEVEEGYVFNKSKSNERLSTRVLEFKRLINNIYDTEKDRNKFNEILIKYTQENSINDIDILTEAGIKKVGDYNDATNQVFNEKFGLIFSEAVLSEPCVITELTKQSELSEEVPKIMNYIKNVHENKHRELISQAKQKQGNKNKSVKHAAQDILQCEMGIKKKSLYLHIGMPKTGTTTIQTTLFNNDDFFRKNNIYYPRGLVSNHSLTLVPLFKHDPKKTIAFRGRQDQDIKEALIKIRKSWIEEFNNCQQDNFVISAEGLSNYDKGEIEKLYGFLSTFFEEIFIVAYIRKPKDFYSSIVQQQIKSGVYIDTLENHPIKRNLSIKSFSAWVDIFGKENILLRPFKKEKFINENLIEDFVYLILGKKINLDELNIKNNNSSLSKEAVHVLNKLNSRFPVINKGEPNKERGLINNQNILFDILNKVEGEKFKIVLDLNGEEAVNLNNQIDDLNEFFSSEDKIEKVKLNEQVGKGRFNFQLPEKYYIDLINAYNRYIEELLSQR